jgi:hypothetical protein
LLDLGKSCRSLDGFTTKVLSHQDCGCLSLSPASSTCSDDVNYNIFQSQENECNHNNMALRKSLSSGALYEVKSWNAFMESFRSASPTCMDGSHNSATPTGKNSKQDAMRILFSTLNDAGGKEQEEQQRQAHCARMKDNDEFISNFLYSSKSTDMLTEDIVSGAFDVSTEVEHNTSSTQSSSLYMCIDKNIMACGENTSGICCSGWFDGTLTVSSVLGLPSSESSSHQIRKRSSINVGGLPSTSNPQLHESYQSDYNCSNNNNSSSWLYLASAQLDGAFDNWVIGSNQQQSITTELDDTQTCLLHVSFQAPTLKKSIHLIHTNDENPLEVYPEIDDESKVDEWSPSSLSKFVE